MTAWPSLREIASALGGVVTGQQVLAPGPGHSPGDRSMAVKLSDQSPDGFVVHSHANDNWQDCHAYVLNRLGIASQWQARPRQPAAPRPAKPTKPTAAAPDHREQALEIWRGAVDPTGTLVDVYLASRRLVLTDDVANRVVRFHPSCPFGPGARQPCMVTLFQDIRTDEPRAIQRTTLQPDGSKISRLTLGPCRGAAIKISPDDDVTMGLTIGEGFETCLAASQLGFRPVWALGSAGAIKEFPVLSGIEALSILAETGPASAGAIEECADRWDEAGHEVWTITPKAGDDLNSSIMLRLELQ
jgi:Toprim domain-containing protein